jgi:hypothetical protein
MKSPCMKIACIFSFLSFVLCKASGQVFVNDAGTREKHFVYEVKQIDEFFERFNNDSNSYVRKVYNTYHVTFKLDRTALIKSLFDYETHSWDANTIKSFVESVTDPKQPLRLDFYHDNWFAEANCRFQFNASTIQVPIILRIRTNNNGGAKWVIAAIKPSPLQQDAVVTEIVTSKNKNKNNFINPESHTNNFIELQKVFEDKENLTDYLDANFFDRKNSNVFYNAVLKNKLNFITVRDIKYHYLQITGWIFTVEYFPRESLNSGWLISSMKQVSATDKELYKQKLLEE